MGGAVAPLVQRERELAVLRDALRDAADAPVLALVLGEAGLGKTRLVTEVAAEAEGTGTRVLQGSCVPLTVAGVPWAPWTQLLRALLRREGRDAVERLAGAEAAAALVPVLPLGRAGGEPPPVAHVLEALLSLVEALAAQRPLVLVLEDLHWADPASLDALSFLVRNLGPVPVLLLATARSATALEELRRAPSARTVELAPLDADGTRALAAALGAADDRLHARSGGNPYYVTQLVTSGGGRSLGDAVLRRLDDDAPLVRAVLDALAVAAAPVAQDLLAAVLAVPEAEVVAALQVLQERQLLGSGPDGHVPAHALAAEAALARLLPGQRARLHRGFVAALDGDPADLPLHRLLALAAHAEGADDPRLAELAQRAACAAGSAGAWAAALAWGRRALGLLPAPPGALLALTAEAALRRGEPDDAAALLERALLTAEAAEPGTAAGWLERRAAALWRCGRATEAAEATDRAAALLGAEPSPVLARVRCGQAATAMLLGRWPQAQQRAEQALALATTLGMRAEQAHARCTLALVHAGAGRTAAAHEQLVLALDGARAEGDPALLLRTLLNGACVEEEADRLEAAAALATEALALVRRHDLGPAAACAALTNAVEPLLAAGRWDEAEQLLAGAPAGAEDDRYVLLLVRARAALDLLRGRPVDDAVLVERGADAEPAVGAARMLLVAERALQDGQPRRALEAVGQPVGQGGVETGRLVVAGLEAVADLLALAPALGGPAEQERPALTARAEALRAALPAAGDGELALLAAEADAHLGRVRDDDRPEHWQRVVERAAARPYRRARAQLRLAHAARGPRAAAALREAHAAALALGAEPLRREVVSLALRTRVDLDRPDAPPPAPDPVAPLALTPRERQVLELLATGASNRMIARSLSITEKTASVHVSNLLGKLGVRARAEATAVAHRLGLAPVGRSRS